MPPDAIVVEIESSDMPTTAHQKCCLIIYVYTGRMN